MRGAAKGMQLGGRHWLPLAPRLSATAFNAVAAERSHVLLPRPMKQRTPRLGRIPSCLARCMARPTAGLPPSAQPTARG